MTHSDSTNVEIRFDDDRSVDEIHANNCSAYLERMSDSHWSLILTTDKNRSHFTIGKKGKREVVVTVVGQYATR